MGSNEQPVVQTILESFTRCFHPADQCNAPIRSNSPKHVRRSSKMSSCSSPTRATSRLELNGKEWDDVFDRKTRSTDSRRRHRRSSSSSAHADVVARAKKAAHRLDAETIEQRSLKRKLEIFRTRDSSADSSSKPSRSGPRQSHRVSTPEELVISDSSDEEIANLTSSRKRFACGLGQNDHGPIASFAKFFNLGPQPNPFGLCFATPVRTASAEQTDKFSDDQLTADEFIHRHARDPAAITPELEISQDSESLSRYAEDDTITSTLYFDQKYAHVIQTRPPMPLFHSQAVPCDDYRSNDLTKIIKRKHLGQRSPARKPQSSPPRPSPSPKSKKYSMHSDPPSPVQVSDKSGSASTSPGADPRVPFRMREPDIMHNTAAEI